MSKIKNINYRKFLDKGEIEFITSDQLKQAINNIGGKYKNEGRALLIVLYYTGCRPVEALGLLAKDIYREDNYIRIKLKGSKRGLPRTPHLPYGLEYVKELYKFASGRFPDMFLFANFSNNYRRLHKSKSGEIKEYIEHSNKVYYYVKKWFNGVIEDSISPYFIRHNRFSKLSEKGIDLNHLRMLKGSKTFDSIIPYQHLSSNLSKKIAKKID